MAAATAKPALCQGILGSEKGRSPTSEASALSMQQFLMQETFCAEPHTDTDIANLLQEISRLQLDGQHSDHNTDRDIEDIISEAENLVSQSSKKIESLSSSTPTINVNRDMYLPYRSLLGQNVIKVRDTKKVKQASKSKSDVIRKSKLKDESRHQDKIKQDEVVNSEKLDVKAAPEIDIPKESSKVSDEVFITPLLQINKVTNSIESIHSPKLRENDAVQRRLNAVLEELKDTKEKLQSIQVQHELLTESSKELKSLNEDLMKENKAYELKLLEKEDILLKMRKELESIKVDSSRLHSEMNSFREESSKVRDEKQKLNSQINKDKVIIQDLQRQCKEMENILMRKYPDSVSALIVASKQSPVESETKKLLEKRISCLESDLKNEQEKYQKTLTNIQGKVNSMKGNYETHISDLEKQVINLQQINSEIKERMKCKEYMEIHTQTVCNSNSVSVQTNNLKSVSAKPRNQPTSASSVGNLQIKEDTHLMATVRGLNSELLTKEKCISKLTKELDEAKKSIQKLHKSNKEGALTKIAQVEKVNARKQIPKSNVKVMKISSDALNNNTVLNAESNKTQDKEKNNIKNELNVLQKDYEKLKKKRVDDLVELQSTHEKELMNLNMKVLPLQHDVESLNTTVEMLRGQIKTMDDQLSMIMTERDHFKCRAEQLNCKLSFPGALENGAAGKLSSRRLSDRDYDDLRTKVMELEKRYEGREVRLKTLINSLAKIRDAHNGSVMTDSGNSNEGLLPGQTYRSC